MNLRESISTSVAALFTKQAVQDNQAATSGVIDARTMDALTRDWDSNFSVDPDRRSRYLDFHSMDTGDIAVILDNVVNQALDFEETTEDGTDILEEARCFKVAVATTNREAKKVLRQAIKDTKIRDDLPEIIRDMVKNGDEFVELLWQGDEPVGTQPHKVGEMYVSRDNKGRIMLGRDPYGNPLAFQQRTDTGRVLAGWDPYQMLHFKLFPTRKLPYSRSGMLDNIRQDWKKLAWLEQGMVLARTTRAYPRLVWQRDMTGIDNMKAESKMRTFILAITRKHTNAGDKTKAPMTPDEDYFISSGYVPDSQGKLYEKRDDIRLLDPNLAGLGNITDIQYQRRKQFNIVPASVVGIFDNTQGDMTPQDISLARFISSRVQRAAEVGLRTLFDRALLAKGIDPENVPYRIIFPRTSVHTDWRYADGAFRNSMKDQNYLAMGVISRESIRKREFGMTDDESAAEEAQIEKELQSLATMYPTNSGQGEGEGLGKLGAGATPAPAPAQNPKANAQQAKSRTGGQNSTPKNQGTRAAATAQRKKVTEALQRLHQEQMALISMFPPTVPPEADEPINTNF